MAILGRGLRVFNRLGVASAQYWPSRVAANAPVYAAEFAVNRFLCHALVALMPASPHPTANSAAPTFRDVCISIAAEKPDCRPTVSAVVGTGPHGAWAEEANAAHGDLMWWEKQLDGNVGLYQVTRLVVLRLLTNRIPMTGAPITAYDARAAWHALTDDPRALYIDVAPPSHDGVLRVEGRRPATDPKLVDRRMACCFGAVP